MSSLCPYGATRTREASESDIEDGPESEVTLPEDAKSKKGPVQMAVRLIEMGESFTGGLWCSSAHLSTRTTNDVEANEDPRRILPRRHPLPTR